MGRVKLISSSNPKHLSYTLQDTSWNSMKQFLAKRGVKDEILSFDPRKVDPKNRVVVEKLLKERANSFDPANAKRASGAAAPLAAWVRANVKFSYVLEKVRRGAVRWIVDTA